ncbi:M23 family metallopeptidase [Leucobacter zeae]|nr:M23 family metallopeptidase [Leucobacter zeae]
MRGAAAADSGSETPRFVSSPVREHVPATAPSAAPPAARTPVPLRRRVAATAAAASVCGLVLAAAVPLLDATNSAAETPGAAAQQRLFSEVSTSDLPASFTDITAVSTEQSVRAAYTFRPEALVNYPFARPVMLTDPFGYRTAPVEQFHDAQDFAAAQGTPIQAIADGTALEAGFASDGCGFGLKLEHEIDGNTVTSRYCHMVDGSHSIKVGDTVKMGEKVGEVGATGMAFGAHLHMAIRVDDTPVDPMPFLAKYSAMDKDDESTKPSEYVDPTGSRPDVVEALKQHRNG